MVNTGKPSNGCVQCRARRVKCDGTRPHCKRCRRYGVICPGYPHSSLVFRDLTVAVREKAVKKYERNRKIQGKGDQPTAMRVRRPSGLGTKGQSTHGPRPPSARTGLSDICASSLTSQPDQGALVEGAVAAFLSQWRNSNVEIWWNVMDVALCRPQNLMLKGSLGIALQAASLMALALRPELHRYDMKRSAAILYGTGLRAINSSLQDPKESLEDNTLIAVMLIALFENMDEVMIKNPAVAHIRGMMSLINARGPGQFKSATGRRIFLTTYFTWTTTVMSEIALMPHMAPGFIPPLGVGLIDILLKHHDFGAQEPAFRLLPLIHRSLVLRATSMSSLPLPTNPSDHESIISTLSEIYALDRDLLAWNSSLPHGVWGEEDHLYQMLTTSLFRTHRIFLADLSIRCYQRLSELDGQSYDEEIWRHVDEAQNAIDNICVRIPYSFAPDNPRKRKPRVSPRIVPDAKITYLYHASFEYPLLVASMVWTLPTFRKRGIENAQKQCATACGLTKPRRKYPKVLIYLTEEERRRYIRFRSERARRCCWQGRTDAGVEFLFGTPSQVRETRPESHAQGIGYYGV